MKKSLKWSQSERLILLVWALAAGETMTSVYVRERFRVSPATAKRDIAMLDLVLRGRKLTTGWQCRREIALANPAVSRKQFQQGNACSRARGEAI